MKIRESSIIIVSFALHILLQSLVFVILYLAVIGLNLFAGWVSSLSLLPDLMIKTLYLVEYLLFGVDVFCFIVIVGVEAFGLVIELIKVAKTRKDGG